MKIKQHASITLGFRPLRTRRWLRLSAVGALFAAWLAPTAEAQERTTFISIDQKDSKTSAADDELLRLSAQRLREPLSPMSYDYGPAITALSEWRERSPEVPYLARVTPYVYIAAEMLGADFEIAGTYLGNSGGTTYRSHFVVNKEKLLATLKLGDQQPNLEDLLAFIREKAGSGFPARFVYHNQFSTSSYFLPALFFRSHGFFAMDESTRGLTAIHSEKLEGNSSSLLVKAVADGRADFAAVWDDTMKKFLPGGEEQERGRRVFFIPHPTELPNDLLVCSRSLLERRAGAKGADKTKTAFQTLFAGDEAGSAKARLDIGIGDFQTWVDINDAVQAREALAGLRWLASDRRVPVTVRVGRKDDQDKRITGAYLEAARQAVRLSGTEFVLHEDGFHKREDYVWTLGWVREGHVTVTSEIPAFAVKQVFHISFQPAESGADQQDLTQRIGNLLTSRLHRLRQIWPYDDERPLVIRDVPFSLAPGTTVKVQKIRWNDMLHNDFAGIGDPRLVEVESVDFFKFKLVKERFRLAIGDAAGATPLDPMSPVAYRVLLMRPQEPQAMFAVLNGVFFVLVGLSAVGAAFTLRRTRRLPASSGLRELVPAAPVPAK